MNNEENHGFTSFDFITMMISFVVIIAVTGPIIKKNLQADTTVEKAKFETAQIGRTLLNPGNLPMMATASVPGFKPVRAIASVNKGENLPQLDLESIKDHLKKGEWEGDIGKDPWGHAYHFSFLKNSKGHFSHVAVWSDGPSGVNENDLRGPASTLDHPESLQFKGDGVGSVLPIR